MPRCYLLAMSKDSALDRDENTMSLFKIVEEIWIRGPLVPDAILPIEIHSYWQFEPEEQGLRFQFRYVSKRGDITRESPPIVLPSQHRRFRMRTRGMKVPSAGYREFYVEWRRAGEGETEGEWQREPISWPIDVHEEESAASEAPEAPAAGK